jgi:glycosyltransferase involved in cell wall biosynthesis
MTAGASRFHHLASITQPYDDAELDLTVFVSCYNEATTIIETIELVSRAASEAGLTFELLVIDDYSKDNSRELVRAYIEAHPSDNVVLVANNCNKGLAQNYMDAAFLGRGKYLRLICGDSPEPYATIVRVFKAIGEADIIVPYPSTSGGRSLNRRVASRLFTFAINSITGNDIHYYNGLAVHLRRNVVRWHTNTRGFGFQAEILCLLIDLGFTYKQIPVEQLEQRVGKSNALTFRNMISVLHTVVEIANRRLSSLLYPSRRVVAGSPIITRSRETERAPESLETSSK